MEQKMLKKRCKYCGKVIESLYQKQLDYNFQAHQLSCKKKIVDEVNGNHKLNKKEVEDDN